MKNTSSPLEVPNKQVRMIMDTDAHLDRFSMVNYITCNPHVGIELSLSFNVYVLKYI